MCLRVLRSSSAYASNRTRSRHRAIAAVLRGFVANSRLNKSKQQKNKKSERKLELLPPPSSPIAHLFGALTKTYGDVNRRTGAKIEQRARRRQTSRDARQKH